ncbi:hypothetical protein [Cesiribacter sp. SM1]|uniref:hypothetical protein n=1 Tax=Cesiribacter sp. SM1 TaxID=2861196 RepID=UPI001CD6B2FC|nr:hypothetical protein [Cesiribacter sp. SM1]
MLRNIHMRWTAYLALSRMANTEATQLLVKKARKLPLGDDLVYELLPDLAWVRQKAATDYLVKLLLLESTDCSSPDPDSSRKITCAYHIMELLVPTIQKSPLQLGTSGDIPTDSYPKARAQASEWFRKNGSNYQLVKNSW